MINKKIKLENSCRSWKIFQNLNKGRAFNKAKGHGKKSKIKKRSAFNKAKGHGKKSKIKKRRAYFYSGL